MSNPNNLEALKDFLVFSRGVYHGKDFSVGELPISQNGLYFDIRAYPNKTLEFIGKSNTNEKIWEMEMSLEIEPKSDEVDSFLSELLPQFSPEKPFRGPEGRLIQKGNLIYFCRTTGDVDSFKGFEHVIKQEAGFGGCEKVYKLDYKKH